MMTSLYSPRLECWISSWYYSYSKVASSKSQRNFKRWVAFCYREWDALWIAGLLVDDVSSDFIVWPGFAPNDICELVSVDSFSNRELRSSPSAIAGMLQCLKACPPVLVMMRSSSFGLWSCILLCKLRKSMLNLAHTWSYSEVHLSSKMPSCVDQVAAAGLLGMVWTIFISFKGHS